MDLTLLAPTIVIAPFVLVAIFLGAYFMLVPLMVVVVVWEVRKRARRSRHRLDPFVARMLGG